ncbi:hypothetical protein P7C71_g289, partial [Lecanoromycetidae sp. Uapishka_2]
MSEPPIRPALTPQFCFNETALRGQFGAVYGGATDTAGRKAPYGSASVPELQGRSSFSVMADEIRCAELLRWRGFGPK